MSDNLVIENPQYWYEPLDTFVSEGQFVVCEIDKADLEEEDEEGIRTVGSVELGAWDALAEILNKQEAELHKKDFETITSYVVALYCDGQYVTTIQGED